MTSLVFEVLLPPTERRLNGIEAESEGKKMG